MFADAGFGTPPKTGFPGEVGGPAAAGEDRGSRSSRRRWRTATGLSVNLVQLARAYTVFATRRRTEAGDAVQGQRSGRGQAGDQARDRARRAPDARNGRAARAAPRRRRRCRATASPARPAPRTSSRARGYTNKYVSSFVGFAPVVEAAAHRRRDDRRAVGRAVTTAATVAAPVFSRSDGRCAAHARRAHRRAGRQRDPAAAGQRNPRGNLMSAAHAHRSSTCRHCWRGSASRRGGSPPTAATCAPATRSRPFPARRPTAAHSSATRSAAVRARCSGTPHGFDWNRAWEVPQQPVAQLARTSGRDRRSRLRPSVAGPVDGRRHRHQRQDVVRAVDRARPRRLRAPRRRARHARQRPGRRARAGAEHDARCGARCTKRWRPARRPVPMPWRWKSRRTASTRGASTRSLSTWRCSPICRATTSTITARWRPTAPPRRGCSHGRGSLPR